MKDRTELENIIKRLRYFNHKYWMSIEDIFLHVERNQVPIQNNLDWIEMVSLVNRLSLSLGKQFDEEDTKQ